MNKPSQWRAYLAMSRFSLKAMVRNPATLAFGFAFPVVFISIFGLIGGNGQNLNLGILDSSDKNNPIIQSVKNLNFVKVTEGSAANLEPKLRQGKLDAILTVFSQPGNPPHYSAELTTTSGNPTGAATANSVISGIVDKTNLALAGVKNPSATLTQQEVSGRKFRYIDFVLPGQIGFSLLSTALFSTVFGFIALKRLLVFKRMFATPVHALTILLSQGTSRLVVALVQTLLIIGIGVFAFNFYLPHGIQTLAELILLSIVGLAAFLGFGIFASGLAKDENSAGPLVNLISLPQMLLSGVFFPTDALPDWVQPIANNLPLAYFNQAVRKVTTEGGTLPDTWPYLIGLLAWGTVMYLLATRTFKWEV
jgi:ABC-2 type transport system permease protein